MAHNVMVEGHFRLSEVFSIYGGLGGRLKWGVYGKERVTVFGFKVSRHRVVEVSSLFVKFEARGRHTNPGAVPGVEVDIVVGTRRRMRNISSLPRLSPPAAWSKRPQLIIWRHASLFAIEVLVHRRLYTISVALDNCWGFEGGIWEVMGGGGLEACGMSHIDLLANDGPSVKRRPRSYDIAVRTLRSVSGSCGFSGRTKVNRSFVQSIFTLKQIHLDESPTFDSTPTAVRSSFNRPSDW